MDARCSTSVRHRIRRNGSASPIERVWSSVESTSAPVRVTASSADRRRIILNNTSSKISPMSSDSLHLVIGPR